MSSNDSSATVPGEEDPTSPPSSISTNIAVGPTSEEEEELYAAAGAAPGKRKATRSPTPSAAAAAAAASSSSRDANGDIGARDSSSNGTSAEFAFDSDMSKYPTSMTSSVRAHVYEGGLRYHAFRDGQYAFPNDEVEQNRDDMKHTMSLMLCRGDYFDAPVVSVLEASSEVLDLGECIFFSSFCIGFFPTLHSLPHWQSVPQER
jgi:hypothetical protein